MEVDDDLVRQVIRPRLRESHKGSYGRVLLVGGLYPYGGAIIMAAIACVNSGAGLVTVATDRDNITALHAHLPEAMAFDLRETERFLDNLRAADVVRRRRLVEPWIWSWQILGQTRTWLLMVQLLICWHTKKRAVCQSVTLYLLPIKRNGKDCLV